MLFATHIVSHWTEYLVPITCAIIVLLGLCLLIFITCYRCSKSKSTQGYQQLKDKQKSRAEALAETERQRKLAAQREKAERAAIDMKLNAAREGRDKQRERAKQAAAAREGAKAAAAAARASRSLSAAELKKLDEEAAAAEAAYKIEMARQAEMVAKAEAIKEEAIEAYRRAAVVRIQRQSKARREREDYLHELEEGSIGTNHSPVKPPIPPFKALKAGPDGVLRVMTPGTAPGGSPRLHSPMKEKSAFGDDAPPPPPPKAEGMSNAYGVYGVAKAPRLPTVNTPGANPSPSKSPSPTERHKVGTWLQQRLPSPMRAGAAITNIFGGFSGRPELQPGPAKAHADALLAAETEGMPMPRFPGQARAFKISERIEVKAAEVAAAAAVIESKKGSPKAIRAPKMTTSKWRGDGKEPAPNSPAPAPADQEAPSTRYGELFKGMERKSPESLPDFIRRALVEKQIELIELMRSLDTDGSGHITAFEFIHVVSNAGLTVPPREVGNVFRALDTDASGSLSYEELSRLLGRSLIVAPSIPAGRASNAVPLRKVDSVVKSEANIFGGFKVIVGEGAEPVPNQIRTALNERHARVVDLFKQMDDDGSGHVSCAEFIKAMEEFGLQAPYETMSAVFASFDIDGSGSIEYKELEQLLIKSFVKAPTLAPMPIQAHNKYMLRTGKVKRQDHQIFRGFVFESGPDADSIPTQLRQAIEDRHARIIDLFHQIDADGSGAIDAVEFTTGMEQFGLKDVPANHLSAVFQSLDLDGSGSIELNELERAIKRSKLEQPTIETLNWREHNAVQAGAALVSKAKDLPAPKAGAIVKAKDSATRKESPRKKG